MLNIALIIIPPVIFQGVKASGFATSKPKLTLMAKTRWVNRIAHRKWNKGCNGLRERRQCQHPSWLLQPAAGSHLNFTFNNSFDFTFFTYFYKLQVKIWHSLSLSIVVFISLSLSWFLQLQIYICLPMLIWRIQVFKQKAKVFMSTAGPRIWWGDKCIRGGDKGGACFRRRGGKFCKKIIEFLFRGRGEKKRLIFTRILQNLY